MKKGLFLFLIILICIANFSCKKKNASNVNVEERTTNDLNYDAVQKLIVQDFAKKNIETQAFCVYESVWVEEDSFYIRKYINAYLEAINKDMENEYSLLLPLLVVLDKNTNEIVRHVLYSTEETNLEALLNEFPRDILKKMIDHDPDVLNYKLKQMHDELLLQAKYYYNIE
ncbi:MAG TPA: hypothetical protein PL063_04545 [Candidatus Cloacimonadota bacterium]|jgi:hypothetical protein|nr:hypothetical protein [Candidatus Cloacimonadales bacterium]HPY96458.1 hypothetical protein [Candidatus Cloacimonadota bacterium]HQB40255.1 hypothetical protein [Candidatus Cloacimonadota bacterium]